jgi:hypothetical protein
MGGGDDLNNLALACYHCNLHKGTNLVGFDPDTGKLARLFNPRLQQWNRHFVWNGALHVGRTATGRATIPVLGINLRGRINMRQALNDEGTFP